MLIYNYKIKHISINKRIITKFHLLIGCRFNSYQLQIMILASVAERLMAPDS